MFSCRTLTRSAIVSCRTLQIAEPKALNLEKDYLAEPWNSGSFRICPILGVILVWTLTSHFRVIENNVISGSRICGPTALHNLRIWSKPLEIIGLRRVVPDRTSRDVAVKIWLRGSIMFATQASIMSPSTDSQHQVISSACSHPRAMVLIRLLPDEVVQSSGGCGPSSRRRMHDLSLFAFVVCLCSAPL